MAPLLEVENMSIKLPSDDGPITIVDDIAFAVEPGEIFGVAGESGSGKTMTTLALSRATTEIKTPSATVARTAAPPGDTLG